jgi:uncharacterized protein (TIGR02271 family)
MDTRAPVQGQTVFDSTGQRIGDVRRVFVDRDSGDPAWATVRGSRFGAKEIFVPLVNSRLDPSGLSLGIKQDVIADAPMIETGSELSGEDASQLRGYYDRVLSGAPTSKASAPQPVREPAEPQRRTEQAQPTELTSFEEQLRVGTEAVENGTVRLHKYVVTDQVETSVPLRHEEVRVERVPAEARASAGHDFTEQSVEVKLHEERPTIAKETVPVETVRLTSETRTDQQRVTDKVRRERIEVEDQRAGAARR